MSFEFLEFANFQHFPCFFSRAGTLEKPCSDFLDTSHGQMMLEMATHSQHPTKPTAPLRLLDDMGLTYICATAERFYAVSSVPLSPPLLSSSARQAPSASPSPEGSAPTSRGLELGACRLLTVACRGAWSLELGAWAL